MAGSKVANGQLLPCSNSAKRIVRRLKRDHPKIAKLSHADQRPRRLVA
jgi:hypothetical protein